MLDLFKKECLLDNVGHGLNSGTGVLSKHKNIKNVGLISQF